MPVPPEDVLYEAIGDVLTDEEIDSLFRRATGKDIYNVVAARDDPRMKKVRKAIKWLVAPGNERWLLATVLFHVAAEEKLCHRRENLSRRVVKAFPQTLIRLPQAEAHVVIALDNLWKVFGSPMPQAVRFHLRPKRSCIAEIVQKIILLFVFKLLQERLLQLLFELSYGEKSWISVASGVEAVLAGALDDLLVVRGELSAEFKWIVKLEHLSAALRARHGDPSTAASLADEIKREVRQNLSRLYGEIFRAVRELSFEPLLNAPPTEIQDSDEYSYLVQAIRDLTATILARALKHRLWQDAENQLSLLGNYLELEGDAIEIANDWFPLRSLVHWLTELEPEETWLAEAKAFADEIETELCKEGELNVEIRSRFEAYCRWFKGPFSALDMALTRDCGSLRRMDACLQDILKEVML